MSGGRTNSLLWPAMVFVVCASALVAQTSQYPSGGLLTDPVALLQRKIDSGQASLRFSPGQGYLGSVLANLGIPVSSQMLVFSKTSLQTEHIAVGTPRAIYFNDDVYVGWIPDAPMMEIASTDPRYGTVFYTLGQTETPRASFQRLQEPCTSCHGPVRPEVPSPLLLMMSVKTDATGDIIDDFFLTTDRSPIEERWGGWYVTGDTGNSKHMGRSPLPDTSRYLVQHSDAVALMLLAHQAEVHNRIGELAQTLRSVQPESAVDKAVEALVQALLFSGAEPLPAPVRPASPFVAEFSANGPRDAKGRSLRDLDLQTRLFRYPLSYLIYSEGFAQLSADAKNKVFRRLQDVLSGTEQSEVYRNLSAIDRTNVQEILTATLPAYATWVSGH